MKDVCELIGVIIGDGSIIYNSKNRTYRLEIAGNATEDPRYFSMLSKTIFKLSKKEPKIRFRQHKKGKGITLYSDNKKFVEFLINEFKLPFGKKTFTIRIPNQFLTWKYSKHVIRGIFEADGSIYFSRSKPKSNYPTYPRIEIVTSSKNLSVQLVEILRKKSFKVQTINSDSRKTIKIYISGEKMLEKWIKEIGFSSPKNISKFLFWKTNGYYIPKTTLKERERLLNYI